MVGDSAWHGSISQSVPFLNFGVFLFRMFFTLLSCSWFFIPYFLSGWCFEVATHTGARRCRVNGCTDWTKLNWFSIALVYFTISFLSLLIWFPFLRTGFGTSVSSDLLPLFSYSGYRNRYQASFWFLSSVLQSSSGGIASEKASFHISVYKGSRQTESWFNILHEHAFYSNFWLSSSFILIWISLCNKETVLHRFYAGASGNEIFQWVCRSSGVEKP